MNFYLKKGQVRVLFSLLMTALVFSCGLSNVSEDENNNSFAGATKGVINGTISGEIGEQRDRDYFKITHDGTKPLLFYVVSEGRGAIQVTLFNHNKKALYRKKNNRGNLMMHPNLKMPKHFYVMFYAFDNFTITHTSL